MYTLKEAWFKSHDAEPISNWDGQMVCMEANAEQTRRTNETQGFMAAYMFTLVVQGFVNVNFNGKQLHFAQNDIFIYSPGLSVTIENVSNDYRGLVIMVDEETTVEMPAIRHLIRVVYSPLIELNTPKHHLSPNEARRLELRMREIIGYFQSDCRYRNEILQMLYSVFVLELQNAQEQAVEQNNITQRTEEIFTRFIALLPHYFAEHHGIEFYAGQLSISPVYLSRVVREVSGRTVVDYINRMLLMETSFLLRTTTQSIAQIADTLNFANASTLSKFFTRLKGVSPKEYRKKQ